MENLNNLEQPEIQTQESTNVNEQIIEGKGVMDNLSLQEGSNFGKFKDATSLLNAYNNLEKEFTKKSQKLSELTKQNLENEQPISTPDCLLAFQETNWQTKVSQFFKDNPEAKNYAKDISTILIADKNLFKNENCLNYAYALAELKNKVKPADLLKDPNFVNDILNNETIKNKIISEYLNSVSSSKHNIRFISGESKNILINNTQDKPKTIKEASNVLKKLLQN